MARGEGEAERLMRAPFAVLSHGTQPDPIFNYGNATAQRVFEMDWQTLTTLPSRFSAEPLERGERQRLLDNVSRHGHSEGYRGVRVSATGRRFRIGGARIWTMMHGTGEPAGQAATFSEWTML